ncbi:metallophosphoesterase [Enterobacter kobei]|uniref:metallophosphoesterase n=1 Tax=Enterobacter kobei TaxID=208224 RepID=UPI000993738C|nr:metallophosphoesterase [Enterobacter kobei]MCR1296434.1 metallophosphoesterase [Enterobacter kobei]MCR2796612.1 metallophosphoesterase [Enterobacter kobei]MDS0024810.1 metallophosphoesterase [Enterobacter kobei]HDT6061223.1 metallophosphoesterase [Enterobacter kobei]
MVSLDSFNKTLQPAATANQQFSLPGDFHVFHIWTLIPALYVLFRFIRPLPAPLSAKIAIAGVMVVASEFHLITKLFTGNMFSPEIPKPLLLLTTGLFGMTVFMAVLLVLRDLFWILHRLVSGRRMKWHTACWFFLPVLAAMLTTQALKNGTVVPEVKKIDVMLRGLPPRFEGYRIVQLTDLHASRLLPRSWIQDVVSRTRELDADMIVVTGDMIDGWPEARFSDIEPLGQLRAEDGVFAVTGNHEYYFGAENWILAFEKLGLHFLNNAGYRVSRYGDSLYLSGVTDAVAPTYGLPGPDLPTALKSSRPGETVILLDHRPENAVQAAESGVSLQLSGHTHGGMIAGLDRLVAPANNGFVSGLYEVGALKLYVSNGSGIWNGFPFRLGKPAEITLITLHGETSSRIVE